MSFPAAQDAPGTVAQEQRTASCHPLSEGSDSQRDEARDMSNLPPELQSVEGRLAEARARQVSLAMEARYMAYLELAIQDLSLIHI